MLNRCVIMGRFTGDPIMRYTQSQTPVASFSLACQRDFGRGEEKEVDFINCAAWRKTADFVTKYFRKGSTAVVEGRLQIRSYTDKDDRRREVSEIIVDNIYFADSKHTGQPGGPNDGEVLTASTFEELEGDVEKDDLPF